MNDRLSLILSPHLDDAVLSLGGCIAAAPERAIVVTVFAGTPPDGTAGRWDRRSGFATAGEAMRARAAENDAALAGLGVAPAAIHNLGYLDNQYRPCGDAAQKAALQSAIADDIRQQVLQQGGAVNLFAPASAWHPDHRIVTEAVLELIANGGCADADVLLYQDQPYAYLELRRKTLAPLRLAPFGRLTPVAGGRCRIDPVPRLLEFSDEHLAKKLKAIHAYRSQFRLIRPALCKMIADFSYYQARQAGRSARYVEVAYRLTPCRRR